MLLRVPWPVASTMSEPDNKGFGGLELGCQGTTE